MKLQIPYSLIIKPYIDAPIHIGLSIEYKFEMYYLLLNKITHWMMFYSRFNYDLMKLNITSTKNTIEIAHCLNKNPLLEQMDKRDDVISLLLEQDIINNIKCSTDLYNILFNT